MPDHTRARVALGVLGTMIVCALPGTRAGATPVEAQVVRGIVHEVDSGQPISGARLLLRDGREEVRAAAITGDAGEFELRSESSGLVRLEVSHFGYADWRTANFALASDAVMEVEVRLDIEAIPLEPLVVIALSSAPTRRLAGFERRRAAPGGFGGYFVTEEDIAHRAVATPSSLVLGTPGMGVRVVDTEGLDRSLITAYGCPARTFVDGLKVQQTATHTVDDILSPDRIAGIELYPRSLAAPPQYQDPIGPDCGVVLFWTHEPAVSEGGGWNRRRTAIGFGLLASVLTLGIIG